MGLNIAYGKFVPEDKDINGKVKGKNQIVRCPDGIPEELWENHLDGTESLGAIPINENKWWCSCLHVFHCSCESKSCAI